MIVWYLLLALMLFLLFIDYVDNKRKERINITTIFIVLVLTLLSGVRGSNYPDLASYKNYFDQIPSLIEYMFSQAEFIRLEPLYQLLISFFKIFSSNHSFFLFFQTLLLLMIVVWSLKRIKAPINIGLILYFFLLYLSQFGQQRMSIVYVLCLFATTCAIRKELKKFLIVVLSATMIQYMAILFLPVYWLHNIITENIKKRSVISDGPSEESQEVCVEQSAHYFIDGKYLTPILNYKFLLKILILIVTSIFLTMQYNIWIDVISFLKESSGLLVNNIYAEKLINYFSRINEDVNIMNALFGLSANITILFFIFYFRKFWLSSNNRVLFVNFSFGLVLFIISYDFPWLTDRLLRMYGVTSLIIIFSLMIATKKNPIIFIPFILSISVYIYLAKIASETGSYNMMSI